MPETINQADLASLIPGLFWPDDEWTVPTLRRCIGRELEAIAFDEFRHLGVTEGKLAGELEFRFRGMEPMKLTITHMFGVSAIPHPLVPMTMDAGRMEWRRRDLSGESPWASLIGARLESIHALIKPNIGYGFRAGVSGLLLAFQNGCRIGYDNWTEESGRFAFHPEDGIWAENTLVEWMRHGGRQKPIDRQ